MSFLNGSGTVGACDGPLNPSKTGRKVLWWILVSFSYCYWELGGKYLSIWNCSAKSESIPLQFTFSGSEFWRYLEEFSGYSLTAIAPLYLCSGKDAHLGWAGPLAAGKGQSKGAAVQGMLLAACPHPHRLSHSLYPQQIATRFSYFLLINFNLWLLSAQGKFFASSSP